MPYNSILEIIHFVYNNCVNLFQDKTYYAASYNSTTGCEDSDRKAITATIDPIPGLASGSNQSRCGNGTVTLTASTGSNGNNIRWYAAASGGSVLSTGTSYTTPSLSSSTTYYAASYNSTTGCEDSDRKAITATINPIPGLASGSNQSRCGNGTVTLTASTGSNGNNIRWYAAASGGSVLQTGTSYTTPSLSATTTYYAASYNSTTGCEDPDRKAIDATIIQEPNAPSISAPSAVCSGTSATFTSNGTSADEWYTTPTGGTPIHTGLSYSSTLNSTTTLYVLGVNSNGCESTSRTSVTVNVDVQSSGGTVGGATEEFGVASGTLTLSNETGSILKWQYQTTGGWSDISHTQSQLNFVNIQEPTSYRAQVQNGTCGVVYSTEALVNVLDVPAVDLGQSQSLRPGQSTTLTADPSHSNYEWFKNSIPVQDGSSNQLIVTEPANYSVTVTSSGNAMYTTGYAVITSQLDIDENAVVSYTFRVPVKDEDPDLFQFDKSQLTISAELYDGLGRASQMVSLEAAPDGRDLVVPIEYDSLGRQLKSYLPFATTNQLNIFSENALDSAYSSSDHYNYYKNISAHNTEKAFSETRVEASPLNRVLEQGSPGAAWQIGSGNTVSYSYGINDNSEVINWDAGSLLQQTAVTYPANELSVVSVADEEGNTMVEYTNKSGQTILKKSQIDATWAETYYVYDDFGQLKVVIPPEASSRLTTEFFGQTESQKKVFLNRWAFLYHYDGNKRMIVKKVPGADSVFMIYDRWDRLVLTQDGVQRQNNTYLFTKYDELNRPIITGIMESQKQIDSLRTELNNVTERFDTLNTASPNQYAGGSFPSDSILNYLTLTYYDSYDFATHTDWVSEGLGYADPESILANTEFVNGLITGAMTKVADSTWIRSVSYYDKRKRVIQSQSTNHLGGKDVVTNYYDFIGQINSSISTHSNGVDTTMTRRIFEYDHAGRLLKTWHQINDQDTVLLAANDYNELGELKEKALHGGEQTVDFAYNIRGWLTSINDSDLSDGQGDLFGMELYYNESAGLGGQHSLHNGNISAMQWSDHNSPTSASRAYTYSYDQLNRLKTADHFIATTTANQYDVSGLDYDLNGNIMSLIRESESGSNMDDLAYSYTGNQLNYVSDAGDSLGFNNSNTGTSVDYDYDANGNMVKDLNKGIDTIYYNHLNRPIKVIFSPSGGGSGEDNHIEYLYDAAGIKLQQKVWKDDTLRKTTDYVGEFIYETLLADTIPRLQLIQHEEGRIIYKEYDEVWDYQYHLKDHLGNVRVTFSATPDVYERIATMENSSETEAFSPWVQSQRNGLSTVGNTSSNVMRINTDTNGNGSQIEGVLGLSNMYSVQKGDKIDLSVKAYYEVAPSQDGFFQNSLLLNMLLFGSTGSTSGTSGGDAGTIVSSSNLDQTHVTGVQSDKNADVDTNVPRAYLNYLIFDKDMKYLNAGFKQISSSAYLSWETVVPDEDIIIEEEGFFVTYVSNETNALSIVDFDDFNVTLTKTNIVQSDDYYPFGLTFNSYSRTASTPQNFKYNGKELQEETGWLDYGARMYQPEIGRFFTQDAYAEKYMDVNPYQYGVNNPILNVDVNGDSVVVGFVWTGPGAYHTFVYQVNEETGEQENIVEGFPENELSEPLDLLTKGFGNLEKSRDDNETDPEDAGSTQTVDIPEGVTEEEFVAEIIEALDSYDNSVDYELFPSKDGEDGNSNSLVGSVLRRAGADFKPSKNAPGFDKDVLKKKEKKKD